MTFKEYFVKLYSLQIGSLLYKGWSPGWSVSTGHQSEWSVSLDHQGEMFRFVIMYIIMILW